MAVLSVDLAYRRWSDLGIVVLDRATAPLAPFDYGPEAHPITCGILPSRADGQPEGPIDANILAGRLNHLCAVRGIRVMMLDGHNLKSQRISKTTRRIIGMQVTNHLSHRRIINRS